jgi:hypothetical protein
VTDLRRLGKPGAYRLGRLRTQGISGPSPPTPFRPLFTRPRHRGPGSLWLLGWLAGAALIIAGAAAGLWFLPFVVGLLAGLASKLGGWRLRVALPAVAAMAVVGWGFPLCWSSLHGQPVAATALVIAAVAGWPAHAAVGIAVTLLIALVQAVVGAWLGRVLAPHPPPPAAGIP